MIPVDVMLLLYLASLIACVAMVALYSERRRKDFSPSKAEDNIFRCVKCSMVYTDDPDVDDSRCPQCGNLNHPIKF